MMDNNCNLVISTTNWQDEFDNLANSAPATAIDGTKPYHKRVIDLEVAQLFVTLLFETDEVFEAALRQAEWLQNWSRRPNTNLHLPKEATDYPSTDFGLMRRFMGWFSLKAEIVNDGGTFLQEIQQHMIGLYLEEHSMPTNEKVRDELLKLPYVNWKG